MRNWKKRVLAGCMAALMACTTMGMTAFAEDADVLATEKQKAVTEWHTQVAGLIDEVENETRTVVLSADVQEDCKVRLGLREEEIEEAILAAGSIEDMEKAHMEGLEDAEGVVAEAYRKAAEDQITAELELTKEKLVNNRLPGVSDQEQNDLIKNLDDTYDTIIGQMMDTTTVADIDNLCNLVDAFMNVADRTLLNAYKIDMNDRIVRVKMAEEDEIMALPNLSAEEKAGYISELDDILAGFFMNESWDTTDDLDAMEIEYTGSLKVTLSEAKAADQLAGEKPGMAQTITRAGDEAKKEILARTDISEADKKEYMASVDVLVGEALNNLQEATTEAEAEKAMQDYQTALSNLLKSVGVEEPAEDTKKPAQSGTNSTQTSGTPQTGDHAQTSLFLVLAVLSLGVVLVSIAKMARQRR